MSSSCTPAGLDGPQGSHQLRRAVVDRPADSVGQFVDLDRFAVQAFEGVGEAGDLLGLYVGAHAFEDTLGTDGDDTGRMMGEYLATVPPERLPHLLAASGELASGDADQRFEFGLDLLIRGLASLAGGPTEN